MSIRWNTNQILRLLPQDGTGELEVRFGKFAGPRHRREFKKIHPSVYDRVKDYIVAAPDGEFSIYTDYKWGNTRRRVFNGGDEWVEKTRLENMDLQEYNLRVSVSMEAPITPLSEEEMEEREGLTIRSIHRHSLQIDNGRIDLSRVEMNGSVRLELEVEMVGTVNSTTLDTFRQAVEKVFKIAYWTENFYTVDEVKQLNTQTNKTLTNGRDTNPNFIDRTYFNDARNLQMNDLVSGGIVDNPDGDYMVTDKADGVRKLLLFNQSGMWLVFPPFEYNLVVRNPNYSNLGDYIIEGEYIPKDRRKDNYIQKHAFYAYDCLSDPANKGRLLNQPHHVRLSKGRHLIHALSRRFQESGNNIIYLDVKTFQGLEAGNFFQRMSDILDTLPELPYDNDGLMIIPDFAVYNPWQGRRIPPVWKRIMPVYPDICKWKPFNELTIDLRVRLVGTSDEPVVALYSANPDTGEDEEWKGTTYNPLDWTEAVDPNDPELNKSGFVPLGTIVEFEPVFNDPDEDFQLKAKRIRHNKNRPNQTDVVGSTWDLAHRPVEERIIRGEGTALMRRYHNRIKRDLFRDNIRPGSSILDIGSGNGGDIDKWPNLSYVVAVEPDSKHREEFERRLDINRASGRVPETTQVRLLGTGGEDVEAITQAVREFVPGGKVDYITFMLSLTFFWRDVNMLNALGEVIHNVLKPGGSIIFLTMDGDYVGKSLPAYPATLILGDVTIKGTESVTNSPPRGIGREIKITIPDSIVGEQTEYLVNLNDLVKITGGTLNKKVASDQRLLNPNELVLTSFYSYGTISNFDPSKVIKIDINKMEEPRRIEAASSSGAPEDVTGFEPAGEACTIGGDCGSVICEAPPMKESPGRRDPGPQLGGTGGGTYGSSNITVTWTDDTLVRLSTIGDGNCLFHAFLNAVSDVYQDSTSEVKKAIVNALRRDLSSYIGENITVEVPVQRRLEELFGERDSLEQILIDEPDAEDREDIELDLEDIRREILEAEELQSQNPDAMIERKDPILTNWAIVNNGAFATEYFNNLLFAQDSCDARRADTMSPMQGEFDPRSHFTYFNELLLDPSEEGIINAAGAFRFWGNETLFTFLADATGVDIIVYYVYQNDLVGNLTTVKEGRERDVVIIGAVSGHYETIGRVVPSGDSVGIQTVFKHDDPLVQHAGAFNPADDPVWSRAGYNPELSFVENIFNKFNYEVRAGLNALQQSNSDFSVFKYYWSRFSPSFQLMLSNAFDANDIPRFWENEVGEPLDMSNFPKPECFKSQLEMSHGEAGGGYVPEPIQRRRRGRMTEEEQLEAAIQESIALSSERRPRATVSTEEDELALALEMSRLESEERDRRDRTSGSGSGGGGIRIQSQR